MASKNQEQETEKIEESISKTIDILGKTQQTKKRWSKESARLSADHKLLKSKKLHLEKKIKKLAILVELGQKKNYELLRKKKETERIKDELSAYLASVLKKIENQIDSDLYFLKEERTARVESLKEMLIDPQISSAEKFRRIFETLQIEAEYGSTVEVIQKNIVLDSKSVLVDQLRLGRISQFFLTIDEKRSGFFNRVNNQWELFPDNMCEDIKKSIAMARQERTVDFVKLPVGRIVIK